MAAVAHCSLPLAPEAYEHLLNATSPVLPQTLAFSLSSGKLKTNKLSFFRKLLRPPILQVKSNPEEYEHTPSTNIFAQFNQLLLPVVDRNPFLSEGTKQATATTAALAKKYGAEITVIVIDEKEKETLTQHETQLASIRWHLSEGGFQEFKLLERLGEGKANSHYWRGS